MKPTPKRTALVGPRRQGEKKGRLRFLLLSLFTLVVAGSGALVFGSSEALERPRAMVEGVLDNLYDGLNNAASAPTSGPGFRQRPGVARPVVAAMTRQVVDSIENTRRQLRELYAIDQPLSPVWLTPDYMVSASRHPAIADQFRARLAFATAVERTAPERADVELALERIYESRELVSEGVLVQAVESYVSWSVGDVAGRSAMATEARDALELDGMLRRYEGTVGWDAETGRLIHPDASVAGELNGVLDRLWPERPGPRRSGARP